MADSRPEVSERELILLAEVYSFQRERSFRYGLRIEYVKHVRDVESTLESLRRKGLVFTIKPYRSPATYILLTKKGRKLFEGILRRHPGAHQLLKASSSRQAWFLAKKIVEEI